MSQVKLRPKLEQKVQRTWRPYRSTKREVLSFFEEKEVIGIHSLIDRFGYTYKGAKQRIYLLHKEGLIEPLFERGTWGLTQKGVRRLMHYGQQ